MKRPLTLDLDEKIAAAPFIDRETGSRWDVAGRAVEGRLKGYTLTWLDSVEVKWFAWSCRVSRNNDLRPAQACRGSESRGRSTYSHEGNCRHGRVPAILPKPFATLQAVDTKNRTVTLLIEGEKLPKAWPLEPDAEVKVAGWWGRPEQFRPGERVWVWLKLDPKKQPVSVVMLADELSEHDIHGTRIQSKATVADKPLSDLTEKPFMRRRRNKKHGCGSNGPRSAYPAP